MSDVFDNDPIYIQKGGILSKKDLEKLANKYNAHLDKMKITVRNKSKEELANTIKKHFNWRKHITKNAGGRDDVAVHFQSKQIPSFTHTTDPIKVVAKRKKALALALPPRENEKRPNPEQYIRHLRLTAPTFLREPPRDVAITDLQALRARHQEQEAELSRVVYGGRQAKIDQLPPFFIIGAMCNLWEKHHLDIGLLERDHKEDFAGYLPTRTQKWGVGRWLDEFLELSPQDQMDNFRDYETGLEEHNPTGQTDGFAPKIYREGWDTYLQYDDESGGTMMEKYTAYRLIDELEQLLGCDDIAYQFQFGSKRDYLKVKQSKSKIPIPFDVFNWSSIGNMGIYEVRLESFKSVFSIKGLNPKYLFANKEQAIHFLRYYGLKKKIKHTTNEIKLRACFAKPDELEGDEVRIDYDGEFRVATIFTGKSREELDMIFEYDEKKGDYNEHMIREWFLLHHKVPDWNYRTEIREGALLEFNLRKVGDKPKLGSIRRKNQAYFQMWNWDTPLWTTYGENVYGRGHTEHYVGTNEYFDREMLEHFGIKNDFDRKGYVERENETKFSQVIEGTKYEGFIDEYSEGYKMYKGKLYTTKDILDRIGRRKVGWIKTRIDRETGVREQGVLFSSPDHRNLFMGKIGELPE